MNRLYGWTLSSRRGIRSLKKLSDALEKISAVRYYTTSFASESLGQPGRRRKHELRTLRPDKLSSVEQPIINLSNLRYPQLRISDEASSKLLNERDAGTRLMYGYSKAIIHVFPTGTQGVFYLYHVRGDAIQSQIRFRLCNALDDFHRGEDLRGLDGSPWKLTLRDMARAPVKYRPMLAFLQQEFPIEPRNIDPSYDCHRVISTLDPQELPSSGQSVMDFSGLSLAQVHIGGSGADLSTSVHYKRLREGGTCSSLAYPPDTIGVFYHKQSLTAPTQLGELRFRLCRDVQQFAQGTDLCLPSGDPWCISSLSIHTTKTYQVVQKFLAKTGLLASSSLPGTANPFRSHAVMPLRVLSDPFVVDLSSTSFRFDVNDVDDLDTTATRVGVFFAFQSPLHKTKRLLRGRAVVRLEECPGLLPGDKSAGPVVTMRFLELLTPVQRLSDDDFIQFPQEGELLHRRNELGEYVPWTYKPTTKRKVWADWIARSRAQV